MENIDNLTYLSFERYFNVLEKTGYMKDKDVNKLIFLMFLLEFLEEYSYYITEEDYKLINNIITCLYHSSCLIPFMLYQQLTLPINNYLYNTSVRITEYTDVRHTLKEEIRLVNL